MSDDISSTQAELYTIYVALREVLTKGKDVRIFVDSRAALDSLNSRKPVYAEIVSLYKALLRRINVTFYWVPSHSQNEKADMLAKCGAQRDVIDVICNLSIRQIRSVVRKEQYCIESTRMAREHVNSGTFEHYATVSNHVSVTYGRDGVRRDAVNEDEVRLQILLAIQRSI